MFILYIFKKPYLSKSDREEFVKSLTKEVSSFYNITLSQLYNNNMIIDFVEYINNINRIKHVR